MKLLNKIPGIIFVLFILITNIFPQSQEKADIYNIVNDAVISICFSDTSGNTKHGCGFYIDSVTVVTNYKNFVNREKIKIKDGSDEITSIKVVGIDIINDVLLLETPPNDKFLKTVNSDSIRIGQQVYAIGPPKGNDNIVNEGNISGINNNFDKISRRIILLNANISQGSSGGALLNEEGKVLGFLSEGSLYVNHYYGVPINCIKNIEKKYYTKKEIYALSQYWTALKQLFYPKDESDLMNSNLNLQKYLESFPMDDFAWYLYGMSDFFYSGRVDKAINSYCIALEINPLLPYSFYSYENSFRYIFNYKDSITRISRLISIEEKPEYFVQRGIYYMMMKRFYRAELDFNKAIELQPELANAYELKGYNCFYLKDYKTAIKMWQKALEIDIGLSVKLNSAITNAKMKLL